MAFYLYSDFNCPFCYALEERLVALGIDDDICWRGVQHAPFLPIPMAPASGSFVRELEQEVRAVKHLAPEVPVVLPPGKPNTRSAIAAVASLPQSRQSRHFKRLIYKAFWIHGQDLSDTSTIMRLADEAGLSAYPQITEQARSIAVRWEREWMDYGQGGVPLLVAEDGRMLNGLVAVESLQSFVKGVNQKSRHERV